MTWTVTWSVEELISGPGKHDDGARDGDRDTIAKGQVDKEGDPNTLRAELMEILRETWPPHALGPTYDIDRLYHIDISEA
jgi:hypothetical protein